VSALRLLVVEDSADDALLIAREIERAWPELDWRRVETPEELDAAFADGSWDAIVADYALPRHDALVTLRRVRELGYDGPFVVVSDTVEEEMTVAAMRAGAHDYVTKNNLRRLVPALERELEEASLRAASRADRRRLDDGEELYRRPVHQLPGLVWTTDASLRITASSGAAALAPTMAQGLLVGGSVGDLQASIGLFDAGQHRRALAGEHVAYEGSWLGRDYLVHVAPFRDPDGDAEGCIGLALDLTERRTAEQALRESEARFRALIENSLDVTLLLEADATVRYASPSVERVLGFRPDEIVGRSAFDLVHTDDAPALDEIFRLAAGSPGSSRTTMYRALHRDGSWHLAEAVGLNMLADPSVRGMVITFRDVTSRRALEERLNQAERLEAIGQLAGGIAHDFNNILLVIRGYSSVLRAELTDPQLVADVDEITKAAERAASLTKQLLVFGRRQGSQPRVLSIPVVVRDLESLLRSAVSEDIVLSLDLDDGAPSVVADPTQIEQVLVNLVVNSRDAMPGGGTITVGVAGVRLDGGDDTATPPLVPGSYAAIWVSDTGSGIPDDVIPHMFEPFFTTKAEGIGTGLGLSTVYGIATQSGGSIGVRTTAGEGTSITVYLPAAAGEVSETRDEGAGDGAYEGGLESVLLVEDEAPVRELVRRVLERTGYRVHAAALPSDALHVLEAGEHVDLLLTDVVMPEMSGYQLAALVLHDHPEIRTLFISGYAHAAAQAAVSVDGDAVLLQKPFAPAELARAVRHVLDGTLPPEQA